MADGIHSSTGLPREEARDNMGTGAKSWTLGLTLLSSWEVLLRKPGAPALTEEREGRGGNVLIKLTPLSPDGPGLEQDRG